MKIKYTVLVSVMILCCLFMSSCALGDALLGALGFDTHDYENEAVIASHGADSETVEPLREMVKMLSVNNPTVPEFENSGDVVFECRDAVLNYMVCTSFAKYTGNPELINNVSDAYPELQVITVIPSEDYEDTVYTFFGGNTKLSHKSATLFTYLDKVGSYIALTVPVEYEVDINVLSCEETENTYRLTFKNTLGEVSSPIYKALIIKREDGSCYFKSLKIAE